MAKKPSKNLRGQMLLFREPDPEIADYVILLDNPRIDRYLEDFLYCEEFGFDLETYSTDDDNDKGALEPDTGEIRLISVGLPSGKAIVADLGGIYDDRGKIAQNPVLQRFIKILGKKLRCPETVVVGQNLFGFEVKWMLYKYGFRIKNIWDTLLASQVFWAGLAGGLSKGRTNYSPHTLDSIAERVEPSLVIEKSVETQKSDWGVVLTNKQINYSAMDSLSVQRIKRTLSKWIDRDGLDKALKSENWAAPAFGSMMFHGMPVDIKRLDEIEAAYTLAWNEAIKPFTAVFPTINPASPKQLLKALNSRYAGINEREFNLYFEDLEKEITGDDFAFLDEALDGTSDKSLVELAKSEAPIQALLLWRGLGTQVKYLAGVRKALRWNEKYQWYFVHSRYQQLARTGMGRTSCLTGDTLIQTQQGLRPLNSIKPGEQVQTSYGFRSVLNFWNNGHREVFRVTLSDGREIRATADHQFLTGRGDTWEPLEALSMGSPVYLSLQAVEQPYEGKYAIPTFPFVRMGYAWGKQPSILSEGLAELFGLYTGDGWLCRDNYYPKELRFSKVEWAFSWEDADVIDKVKAICLEELGKEPSVTQKGTCPRASLSSVVAANLFHQLGFGEGAINKRVPEFILQAPQHLQAAFLRGLFESDGSVTETGYVSLKSVSLPMLQQVQVMLTHFGIYADISPCHDQSGFGGHARHQLRLGGKPNNARFLQMIGFISGRKQTSQVNAATAKDGDLYPFDFDRSQFCKELRDHFIRQNSLDCSRCGSTQTELYGKKNGIQKIRCQACNAQLLDRLRRTEIKMPRFCDTFGNAGYGKKIRLKTIKKWVALYPDLPCLQEAKAYLQRSLKQLFIESIEPAGIEEVFDIEVEDVHEFLANGLVVHNCSEPNVQNPSNLKSEWRSLGLKNIREIFAPPPGYKLIIADLAQAHAQIAAFASEDEALNSAYAEGKDTHCLTASTLAQKRGYVTWDYDRFVYYYKGIKDQPEFPGFEEAYRKYFNAIDEAFKSPKLASEAIALDKVRVETGLNDEEFSALVKWVGKDVTTSLRLLAKPVFYGSLNLQGPATLQATAATGSPPVYMTLEEAGEGKEAWVTTYAGLSKYQRQQVAVANVKDYQFTWAGKRVYTMTGHYGEVRSLCGRRLYLEKFDNENWKGDIVRSVKATDCVAMKWMGTEATGMKYAMGKLQDWLDENREKGAFLCRMAHDELNLMVPEENALEVATVTKDCMDWGMQRFCPTYQNDDKVSKMICSSLAEK